MDIYTNYYYKSSQQLSLFINKSQEIISQNSNSKEILPKNTDSVVQPSQDKLNLSQGIKDLNDLGLRLTNFSEVKNSFSINFQYSFSNSQVQVQSSGNYDIHTSEGNLSITIDLSKFLNNESGKSTGLPKEIKFNLDFSLNQVDLKSEKGTITESPDILSLVTRILNKVAGITKDGQNKDISLSFEDFKTFLALAGFDKGKITKLLMDFLAAISKAYNSKDTDGKRDHVTIEIPDKEIQIPYESKEISVSLRNIHMEFTMPTQPDVATSVEKG